ncbi:MAG: type II secretion system protein [Elusimicrobia bacterium]|nr:type II secretion system protein [Elusimicrobiota bacterium]
MKGKKLKRTILGFTLTELIVVISLVVILSLISVPVFNSNKDKAKMTEAYVLLAAIRDAQKRYYSDYGTFYRPTSYNPRECINDVLGINATSNKYFTRFCISYWDYRYSGNSIDICAESKEYDLWTRYTIGEKQAFKKTGVCGLTPF